MTRTVIASLLGASVAALIAWKLGGVVGAGVMAGFLLGVGIAGLGLLYQRHALLYRPNQAMQALGVSMLAKFVTLLVGALAFRFVEAAAARADWKAFLLAYGVGVCFLMPFGARDLHATLKSIQRRRAADGQEHLTPSEA